MRHREINVKSVAFDKLKQARTVVLNESTPPAERARVYVPQIPTRYDPELRRTVPKFDTFKHAEEFGELVILLDRNNDVWDSDACIAKLQEGLLAFDYKTDFLLPMGSHHFQIWAAMILTAMKIPTLQTLQWHSRNNEYVVIDSRIPQ